MRSFIKRMKKTIKNSGKAAPLQAGELVSQKQILPDKSLYKGLFHNFSDAMVMYDLDGVILDMNNKALEIFRLSNLDPNPRNILDLHPRSAREKCERLLKIIPEMGSVRVELSLKNSDGNLFPAEMHSTLLEIEGRKIVLAIIRDITKLKQAKITLQKNEERYKTIFESFLDFYYRTDMSGILTNVSPSCYIMSGYTVDELIGRRTSDFYPDPNQREKLLESLFRDGAVYDYEVILRNKAGNDLPVSVCSRIIRDDKGAAVGIEGTLRDISKRKQAEESLKERKALLQATIESTADGILAVDEKGHAIIANSRFVEMWRIPPDILETRDDNKLLNYVLDQLQQPEAFLAKIKQLYASFENDKDMLHFKDGRLFERFSSPLVKDQKLAGRVWSFRDITELNNAERLLEESERKYRSLINTIRDGIMTADLEENILYANRAICEMLGYSQDELIGKNIRQMVPERDFDNIIRETQKRIRNESSRYEITMIRKGGERLDIRVSATPYLDDSGIVTNAVGVFSDITELKRAEKEKQELKEKLINAQKMESLGVLAGGVAHDLNNILGPLVAYPELIRMDLPSDSPIISKLARIEKSAQRAAEVVQDLLTLARRGRYEMLPMDINELIDSYLKSADFLDLLTGYPKIKVRPSLDHSIPRIHGSQTHLYKVIMNLTINAIDAMPEGGEMLIKSECREVDRLINGFMHIEHGKYDIITITDTGIGIEQTDIKRIFEPFYSKKRLARKSGSGLGLSIVYGVVKDHNGYIDVVSEVNEGSSFFIYLPAAYEDKAASVDLKPCDIRGDEKILVVDDVMEQRELASTVLSSFGYKVETAASGEDAIEYLRNNSVDVVILDMIMEPGMDGLDTYIKILEIRPGQKAVVSTGFSETERVKKVEKLGAGKVVRKPYTMQSLGKAIRELLTENQPIASPTI